jgi:hypothetical protein
MKKVKAEEVAEEVAKATIQHYSKYKKKPEDKGVPMVRVKGNFYGDGFNFSKNKAIAIMDNVEEIKKFAAGEFDKEIMELKDGEVLIPE